MRFFYLNAPPAARTNWEKRARTSPPRAVHPPREYFYRSPWQAWRRPNATHKGCRERQWKKRKNDRTTGYPSSNRDFCLHLFYPPLETSATLPKPQTRPLPSSSTDTDSYLFETTSFRRDDLFTPFFVLLALLRFFKKVTLREKRVCIGNGGNWKVKVFLVDFRLLILLCPLNRFRIVIEFGLFHFFNPCIICNRCLPIVQRYQSIIK